MGCRHSMATIADKGAATHMESQKAGAQSDPHKEEKLEAALRMKRRYQHVFETVDFDGKVAVPKQKDEGMQSFLARAIKQNVMFATRDDDELTDIVQYFARQQVRAGDVVIKEGERGDYFYVVQAGWFDFLIGGKKVGSCSEGSSFGELALAFGAPRAATVVAKTRAIVWTVNRTTFRATLAKGTTRSRERVLDALSTVELLDGLTDEQLETIADAVQAIKYEKGERIITKNETGNVFYMIQSGQVICTDIGYSNQVQDLTLSEGEYFGERALLTDQLRFANVTAKTDATLLALDREAFNRVLGPLRKVLDQNLFMRVLEGIEVMTYLTKDEMQQVVTLFTERTYQRHQNIITQGDAGLEFFILKAGTVRVEMLSSDVNTPAVVSILEAGDYFGEVALLSGDKRAASVVCESEYCECFVLSRTDFEAHFGRITSIVRRTVAEQQRETASVTIQNTTASVCMDDFDVLCKLGRGTFGSVSLVRNKADRQLFALKTMHKAAVVARGQVSNALGERQILELCKHPFVVRLFAAFQDPMRLHLLLDFLQGGELYSLIHTPTSHGLPEGTAIFFAAAVCLALQSLHDKHVVHRDIRPENVIIDAMGYPKLVDFGFAKVVTRKTYTLCGTPEYLAPEVVLCRGHNHCVDWWAYGVLIFEMIAGYSPFANSSDQFVVLKNIINDKIVFPNSFPADPNHLCHKLLDRNPTERFGINPAEPVFTHRWFANNVNADDVLQHRVNAPWCPKIEHDVDCTHFRLDAEPEVQDDSTYKDDPGLWVGFSSDAAIVSP